VLLDDGRLVLVVPDMRYTFDVHRHQTTVGQMLEAHDLEASRPSVRAVYDNFSTVAKNPSHDAWQGLIPGEESRYHDLNHVLEQVARVRDGEYVDCHVWTFTPLSFVEQTLALCELGVCEFVPESWEPTPPNDIEFVVVLRRLRRGMSHDERLEERRKAERFVPVADRFRGTARPEIFELSEVREELLALDANSKQIIADLRRDIGVLLHELNAIKSSERWRVGGLIASPATRVARAVRPLRRRFQRSSEP